MDSDAKRILYLDPHGGNAWMMKKKKKEKKVEVNDDKNRKTTTYMFAQGFTFYAPLFVVERNDAQSHFIFKHLVAIFLFMHMGVRLRTPGIGARA